MLITLVRGLLDPFCLLNSHKLACYVLGTVQNSLQIISIYLICQASISILSFSIIFVSIYHLSISIITSPKLPTCY
jgi:hypothetical protein